MLGGCRVLYEVRSVFSTCIMKKLFFDGGACRSGFLFNKKNINNGLHYTHGRAEDTSRNRRSKPRNLGRTNAVIGREAY